MAVLLLLLYALVHAAAAVIAVPAHYLSAGGIIVSVGAWLFALSARTLRDAWARLSLVSGIIATLAGALFVAAATWSDDSQAYLPIEIPWALQVTAESVVRSTVNAIAAVSLGLVLLIVAYGLHHKPTDDRP